MVSAVLFSTPDFCASASMICDLVNDIIFQCSNLDFSNKRLRGNYWTKDGIGQGYFQGKFGPEAGTAAGRCKRRRSFLWLNRSLAHAHSPAVMKNIMALSQFRLLLVLFAFALWPPAGLPAENAAPLSALGKMPVKEIT